MPPVSGSDVPIERCTQLRRANLGLEIHVESPKRVSKPNIHSKLSIRLHRKYPRTGTPSEVARCNLHQVVAQIHDAVEIVHLAVGSQPVGRRPPFSVMKMSLVPDFCDESRHPIEPSRDRS